MLAAVRKAASPLLCCREAGQWSAGKVKLLLPCSAVGKLESGVLAAAVEGCQLVVLRRQCLTNIKITQFSICCQSKSFIILIITVKEQDCNAISPIHANVDFI